MIKATATPPIEVHHRCPTGQKAPNFVLQAAGIVLAYIATLKAYITDTAKHIGRH